MPDQKPDLGEFYSILKSTSDSFEPSLSFLSRDWENVDEWRNDARKRIGDLLGFHPKDIALNPVIESKSVTHGIVTETISYDLGYCSRTQGFFLYPESRGSKKLPGFLALHDHSGYYYFGKEKLVDTDIRSESLSELKRTHYGGKSWASELAAQGFAVLVIDVSLWGSRKVPIDTMNSDLITLFDGLKEGSEDFIATFNQYWDSTEGQITIATILNSGTCWPAIHLYEDQRSIDYILTRPEVDPERIGCGGLSMGGQRTLFLVGMDYRIKFGLCVGFMSTTREMLRNHIRGHGIGFLVPGLVRLMDLPDVISLHAPSPLMVQYNNHDRIFSLEGQKSADRKIAEIYSRMGSRRNYAGRFYDGRHKFDSEMQQDAFRWIEEQVI